VRSELGGVFLVHIFAWSAMVLSVILFSGAGTGWLLVAIAPVWFRRAFLRQWLNSQSPYIGLWRALAGVFAIALYTIGIGLYIYVPQALAP
jgi:hypothetical protein